MSCLIHKWNGCVCEKCRRVRDKEHDWNGCKCKRCGKTRTEGHNYIYKERWKSVFGQRKLWCEGECQICGNIVDIEHDYQPTDKTCQLKCSRCGYTVTNHDFQPIPGRCAEVCNNCGEERDYKKIALDESETASNRGVAIKKLKEANMLPEILKKNCAGGKHIWTVSKENPQRFQGGASSTEYTCVVCGKKNLEVDWGD